MIAPLKVEYYLNNCYYLRRKGTTSKVINLPIYSSFSLPPAYQIASHSHSFINSSPYYSVHSIQVSAVLTIVRKLVVLNITTYYTLHWHGRMALEQISWWSWCWWRRFNGHLSHVPTMIARQRRRTIPGGSLLLLLGGGGNGARNNSRLGAHGGTDRAIKFEKRLTGSPSPFVSIASFYFKPSSAASRLYLLSNYV